MGRHWAMTRDPPTSQDAPTVPGRYRIHGVGLRVSAPADLMEVLDRRLVRYAHPEPGDAALRLALTPGRHTAAAAAGRIVSRGSPLAALGGDHARYWYDDARDLLSIEGGGRELLRVWPGAGRAEIDLPDDYGAALRLYTHMLSTVAIMEMLRPRGLVTLHASAVAAESGAGVVAFGASGSGKSTLSLALMAAGLPFLGDDMLFLRRGTDGVDGYGFADEVDLTGETVRLLPGLERAALRTYPGGSKFSARPESLFHGRVLDRIRPLLLLFPRVAHAPATELRPLSRGEALKRLVPTLLPTSREGLRRDLPMLSELTAQCRCVEMRTGLDIFSGDGVRRLLTEAAEQAAEPPADRRRARTGGTR